MERLRQRLRSLQTAWSIIGVVVILLLVLEGLARTYYFIRKRDRSAPVYAPEGGSFKTDEREFSDIYEDLDWSEDYFREKHAANDMNWRSYVYWRKKPFAGDHIHVDGAGIRATYTPFPLQDNTLKIFTFGGSTMWGAGARDNGTIASHLAMELEKRGYQDFHVTNHGEDGYVFTQEMLSLMLELRRGNVPDIAIFYHGVNDTDAFGQTGRAGLPLNEANRVREFNATPTSRDYFREKSKLVLGVLNLAARLRPAPPSPMPQLVSPPLGDQPLSANEEFIRIYRNNIRTVQALASEFGFEAFFFWQPRMLSKELLSDEEERIAQHFGGQAATALQAGIYKQMKDFDANGAKFHDLQRLFDGRPETIYSDLVHIGEKDNKIVAQAIVKRITEQSETLGRASYRKKPDP